MSSKNRYSAWILIMAVFTIDCLTENWQAIFYGIVPKTRDEFCNVTFFYTQARSFFAPVPYLIMGIFAVKPQWFKFDIFDKALLCLFFLSCAIDCMDFVVNNGARPTYLDWPVFIAGIIFITIFKILAYKRKWIR